MDEFSKYIVFQLNDQAFGVNIQQISSIERLQEVTKIPRTSDFIKGVINLRGETTPVIDLKERLLIDETKPTEHNRFLIVQINTVQVGLIVDSATEVVDINPTVIETAPEMIGGVKETFIQGVAKLADRLLILLDLEQILDFNETNEVKEIVD